MSGARGASGADRVRRPEGSPETEPTGDTALPGETPFADHVPEAPPLDQDRVDQDRGVERERPSVARARDRAHLTGRVAPRAAPAPLASAGITVSTPAAVLRPLDVLGRVQSGTFGVAVPMRAGHVFGNPDGLAKVVVRPDTWATVQLAVVDGKVDREHTQIAFRDSQGRETDLDGPLWWNAERIYIDDQGRIRAEVPCFPDPDITAKVLGDGHERIPDDPQKFLELLGGAALPTSTMVGATSHTFGVSRPVAGSDVAAPGPAGPVAPPRAAPTGPAASPTDSPGALDGLLDLSRLRMSFDGTFKSGPISFGDGATVTLDEGGTAKVRGTLDDMTVDIDAPVRRTAFRAQGTRIDSGPGRAGFTVHVRPDGGSDLQINTLETAQLRFETPAADGGHHLLEVGARRPGRAFQISAANGQAPLIRTSIDANGTRQLAVNLPRVALDDLRGELQVTDAHGAPSTVTLGAESVAEGTAPMRVVGSVVYDSRTEHFAFDSQIDNLQARVRDLALVDTETFDMNLREMAVRGSGRFAVTSDRGAGTLLMEAGAEDWQVDAQIEDAKLGIDEGGTSLIADLSPATHGTMRVRRLAYGTGDHPEFEASAQLRVSLDGLRTRLGSDEFSIRPGQQADLVIERMAWTADAASPEVRAKLVLDISGDAIITPERVAGLRGAEVKIVGGRTLLMLDVTLGPDGTLETDVGMTLRAVEVRTKHANGAEPTREVTLPSERLSADVPPVTMREVSGPSRRAPTRSSTAPAPEVALPPVPGMRLAPTAILSAIEDCQVTVAVPADAFNVRVFNLDTVHTESTLGMDDTVGLRVNADVSRDPGNVQLALVVQGGRVVPDRSRLTLDPPLSVAAAAQVFGVGPATLSADASARVTAVVIKRDPTTGEGYLWPEISFDGWVLQGADLAGVGDKVRAAVGDKLAETLFGKARFPLDRDGLLAALGARVPLLRDPIVISEGSAGSDGAATPPPTRPPPPPPATGPAEQLLAAIHLDRASVQVQRARFAPTTLDLGDGQKIEFRAGTELTVAGSLDDFTIEGTAVLGAVNIGVDKDSRLALDSGHATLKIRVRKGADGKPIVDIQIDELHADNATFDARIGGVNAHGSEATIRRGSVHVRRGGTEPPLLDLDLRDVSAKLTAKGRASSGDLRAGAELLRADVQGSLRLANGAVSGELSHVSLEGAGVAFAGGGVPGAQAGRLNLSGAATLSTDASGQLLMSRRTGSPALTLTTDLHLADGTDVAITNGSAELIAFSPDFSQVKMYGLQAEISARMELGAPSRPGEHRILQIRRGRIERPSVPAGTPATSLPGVSLGSAGFSSLGALQVRDLDASITNLGQIDTANGGLDVSQIDLSGDASMALSPAGAWNIRGVRRERDAETHSGLRAVAVSRSATFTTTSPKVQLETEPGATLTTEVDALELAPRLDGVRMALRRTHVEAKVKTGVVTLAPAGNPLETVKVGAGTRVAADLDVLDLATGNLGGPGGATTLRLDGTLRLEGSLEDEPPDFATRLPADGPSVQVEPASVGGTFRMIMAARFADGNFAANSHTLVDAVAQGHARTKIDPERLRSVLRRHQGR